MNLMILEQASKRLSGAFDGLVVLGGHIQGDLSSEFPSMFLVETQRNTTIEVRVNL